MNQRRCFMILGVILFALLVQPLASAEESTNSAIYEVRSIYRAPNSSSTTATNVVATIYIFDNRSGWASQHVLSEQIQLSDLSDNYRVESPTEDNRLARISLHTIGPGQTKTITITQVIKVDYVDLQIDPNTVQGSIPADLLQYTQPVAGLWESDDPTLASKALELIENQSNLYYKAEAILNFVKSHLIYQIQATDHSALWAYTSGVGDCSEFTNLFIALCRAAGIPAKFVSGYGYDSSKGEDFAAMGHAFVFIYLPNVGWAPVDAVWQGGQFGELSNDHLVLLTSDGKGLVKDTQIKVPGDRIVYNYAGPNPDIGLETTSTITREVAVESMVYAGSKIQDSTWRFSVEVSNLGTQSISDVRVELQTDNTYFEVPPAQEVSAIGSEMHQMVYFDVHVKQSVENSLVTAVITYDTPYGTFRVESQVSASATLPPPISELPIDLILILLACVVGIIVVVAVVLLRR